MSELARKRQRASVEPSRLYARRRKALISAAAEVFRMRGLSDASLLEISDLIGVERASLYYYFGSKEQLFRAVILESTEAVVAQAQAISTGPGSYRSRLTAIIAHIVGSFSEHYPSIHIFVREDMRSLNSRGEAQAHAEHQRLADLADQYMRTLEDLIKAGVAAGEFRDVGDPRLAALVIQGAMNWMHRWYDPAATAEAASIINGFVTILLDGMAITPPGEGQNHGRETSDLVSQAPGD